MRRALKFLHQFLWIPLARRSGALFLLQIAQLLHDRFGGALDEPLRRLIAFVRPPKSLPKSALLSDAEIDDVVSNVRTRGWAILPIRLHTDDIDELRNISISAPAYSDNYASSKIVDLTSRHQARYEWPVAELLKTPAIQNLLKDSSFHRIAQDYLGCLPILTSISMWLDNVYDGTYDAYIYHYDNDGPRFLKFFIYLSDVDVENGAHSFIEGSHGHRKPNKFQHAVRYDRNALLTHYGERNEIIFSAPAGTIIVEDTSGFHRGSPIKKGHRLLVQLEYSVLDIPHLTLFASAISKIPIPGIHQVISKIARKFII
jgi:hypothetical protein